MREKAREKRSASPSRARLSCVSSGPHLIALTVPCAGARAQPRPHRGRRGRRGPSSPRSAASERRRSGLAHNRSRPRDRLLGAAHGRDGRVAEGRDVLHRRVGHSTGSRAHSGLRDASPRSPPSYRRRAEARARPARSGSAPARGPRAPRRMFGVPAVVGAVPEKLEGLPTRGRAGRRSRRPGRRSPRVCGSYAVGERVPEPQLVGMEEASGAAGFGGLVAHVEARLDHGGRTAETRAVAWRDSKKATASSPGTWRWPPLLLRGLEVGVRAALMVGHIHHAGDFRHGLDDGPLDPLAERDGGHPAALTAAT